MIYIFLLLIILGLTFNKSKIVYFLTIIFMLYIYAFSNGIADESNYMLLYDRYSTLSYWSVNIDIGYQIIIKLSSLIGLDFLGYKIVVGIIGLSFISLAILRNTKRPNLFLVLYLIYPFFIDVAQHRSFLSFSILIYSFTYLKHKDFKHILLYCLFVLISASIHSFTIVFIPFALINVMSKKSLKFLLLSATTVLVVIVLNDSLMFKLIDMLTNNNRYFYDEYFSSTNASGYFMVFLELGFRCIFFIYIYKHINMNVINQKSVLSNELRILDISKKLFIYLILFIPLLYFSSEVHRGFRYVYVFQFLSITAVYRYIKGRDKNLVFLLFVLVNIVFSIVKLWIPYYDSIIKPILNI